MGSSGRQRRGAGLAERISRALVQKEWRTARCDVVVVRFLAARAGPGRLLPPAERKRTLATLARRVRPLLRAEDVLVRDPTEGLGILLDTPDPEAARVVAQRLRDALSPLREAPWPQRPKAGRKAPRGMVDAMVDQTMPGPLVRLGLGYATLGPDELGSADAIIRSAWRSRMRLCLPVPAGLAAERAHARKLAPIAATASTPGAGSAAMDGRTSDGEPHEEAAPTVEASGARHLRLIQPVGLSRQEREALHRRASYLSVPYMRLPPRLSPTVASALSLDLARELRAVVVGRTRSALTVAMENPCDAGAVLRLRAATGLAIFPVLAASVEIDRALSQLE